MIRTWSKRSAAVVRWRGLRRQENDALGPSTGAWSLVDLDLGDVVPACRASIRLYDQVEAALQGSRRTWFVFLSIDTDEDRNLVARFWRQQHGPRSPCTSTTAYSACCRSTRVDTVLLIDRVGGEADERGFCPRGLSISKRADSIDAGGIR